MVRKRKRMVPRAGANDAPRPLRRVELHQQVARAALLEGTGRLKEIALAPHIEPEHVAQPRAPHARRAHHTPGDALGGAFHILEGDRCVAGVGGHALSAVVRGVHH